jgi:hypothetical protein
MDNTTKDGKDIAHSGEEGARDGQLQVYRGILPDHFFTVHATSESEAVKLMVRELIDLLNKEGEEMIMAYPLLPNKGDLFSWD